MPPNRRLLLIDDDPGVRDAYVSVFAARPPTNASERSRLAGLVLGLAVPKPVQTQRSFELTLARQGREAVDILRQMREDGVSPAVAFVDMRMPPGWDGLTTIEALWAIDPRLQCVLCTAFSDFSWEEIVARLGMTDRLLILRKPFDRIEVLQMAESLCAKWESAEMAAVQSREMIRQQAILRGIIDHSGLLITLKDAEGRYVLANQGFCRRYGVDETALIGRQDAVLSPEVAVRLAEREAAALGSGLHEAEEDDLRRPGEIRLSTIRFTLAQDQGAGPLLCTVASDVSAVRDLEARYLQSQKMEALGRLAGGIAHDFNTLLAAIIGFSELALHGRLEDRTRGQIGQVLQAGQQAADLTRQLLAFSRRQVLKPQRLDVAAVVTDLVSMLTRLVGQSIAIATAFHGSTWILIDRSQLQQVLVNLVVNARDAINGQGQVLITVDGRADHQVQVRISDNGSGMNAEVLAHIWDPFFTTKGEGKGTGLGMSTVHGIVLQSGGTIDIESQPGIGTTVSIVFPAALETPSMSVPLLHPVEDGGGNERILVVDDREDVRTFLCEVLTTAGYQVCGCSDALVVAQDPPECDLLLTDVVMPGLTGPELVDRLRSHRPELRVLFMTGHTTHPDDLSGPVLAKPFTQAVLLTAVRQALG